jgi:hypothetical protein
VTVGAVILRYQQRYGALRASTVAQVEDAWRRFGGLDDAAGERFVAAVVPIVGTAQATTANLLAAYLRALSMQATGEAPNYTIDPAAVTGEALRGVPPDEVYRRPVVTARAAVSNGNALDVALRIAQRRAGITADIDVALAQRAATVHVLEQDDRIHFYRRVLTGRSCMFCATASTQRYRGSDLMPLHGRCDCAVAPIFGDEDPGQVINHQVLSKLKAKGPGYWKERGFVDANGDPIEPGREGPVAVRQHGELGPTLVDRHDHFDGPSVAA